MRELIHIIIIIFTLSILAGQDIWGGISVATPENLDAITNNPAGLGISRGNQSGFYIPFDSPFTIHSSNRMDGFGYDLKYEFIDGNFPDTFNPSDGNIGIGFPIFHNAFAGIKWNKHHLVDFGFLYRPLNFASFGVVSHFNDEFTEYNSSTLGMALRPLPFLDHKFTMGVDINIPDEDSINYFPHLTLQPADGIIVSAQSDAEFENFQN